MISILLFLPILSTNQYLVPISSAQLIQERHGLMWGESRRKASKKLKNAGYARMQPSQLFFGDEYAAWDLSLLKEEYLLQSTKRKEKYWQTRSGRYLAFKNAQEVIVLGFLKNNMNKLVSISSDQCYIFVPGFSSNGSVEQIDNIAFIKTRATEPVPVEALQAPLPEVREKFGTTDKTTTVDIAISTPQRKNDHVPSGENQTSIVKDSKPGSGKAMLYLSNLLFLSLSAFAWRKKHQTHQRAMAQQRILIAQESEQEILVGKNKQLSAKIAHLAHRIKQLESQRGNTDTFVGDCELTKAISNFFRSVSDGNAKKDYRLFSKTFHPDNKDERLRGIFSEIMKIGNQLKR